MNISLCLCLIVGAGFAAGIASAQEIGNPIVHAPAVARESATADLENLTAAPLHVWREGDPVRVEDDLEGRTSSGPPLAPAPKFVDELLAMARAKFLSKNSGSASIPAPVIGVNHDGIASTGALPPDPVGAVGPNHYIQMVNEAFAIFDKSGKRLAGPLRINSLWKSIGGPCETYNAGDPIVRYDVLADRWLVSQFQLDQHMQCIAISRGPDPTKSGWFLYGFPTIDGSGNPVSADYPKLGVWPDGYYMSTQRGFPSSGIDVWVFERDKMLEGQPARQVQFSIGAPSIVLQPSHFSGPPPPPGTPNFFVRAVDGHRFNGQDRIEIYAFSVNWANPQSSTFQNAATLPVTPFNSILCDQTLMDLCVPQPKTDVRLETLSVWPMYPAQYRKFPDHEVLLLNHTVNADGKGRAGIRWYELRRPTGGTWSIFQQSTHSPDSANRWMGSMAIDQEGNIALAYSVASAQIYPSIRAAIRRPTDPPGLLGSEAPIVIGGGSQTDLSARWGDYTSLDVDPANPCSFWVTGLYYAKSSNAGWSTRIAQMQAPGLAPNCNPLVPSLEGFTLAGVRHFLENTRLNVGKVQTLPPAAGSGKLSAPIVVDQSLESGVEAKTTDRIDLVLQRVRQQ